MRVNNPNITHEKVVDLFDEVYIKSDYNFVLFNNMFCERFGYGTSFIGGIQDFIRAQENKSVLNQMYYVLIKYK